MQQSVVHVKTLNVQGDRKGGLSQERTEVVPRDDHSTTIA